MYVVCPKDRRGDRMPEWYCSHHIKHQELNIMIVLIRESPWTNRMWERCMCPATGKAYKFLLHGLFHPPAWSYSCAIIKRLIKNPHVFWCCLCSKSQYQHHMDFVSIAKTRNVQVINSAGQKSIPSSFMKPGTWKWVAEPFMCLGVVNKQ
jgi:hypothetical protein